MKSTEALLKSIEDSRREREKSLRRLDQLERDLQTFRSMLLVNKKSRDTEKFNDAED